MEHHAAAEHLQVIRTLMERSALYRRALAPIMLYVGSVGALAGAGGLAFGIGSWRAFCAWWLAAAVAALTGAFVIARRQALEVGEPFWSPPTLRVAQAIVPPLAAGLVLSLTPLAGAPAEVRWLFVVPTTLFYGCAVHAAGSFMPRGMKLFGWLIIGVTGLALPILARFETAPGLRLDHVLMGALFGLLHLAYGAYLYVTDSRQSPA
jgi:hypothetical protein